MKIELSYIHTSLQPHPPSAVKSQLFLKDSMFAFFRTMQILLTAHCDYISVPVQPFVFPGIEIVFFSFLTLL